MTAITDTPASRNAGTGALGISPAQGAPKATALDSLFAERDRLCGILFPGRGRQQRRRTCREHAYNAYAAVDVAIIAQAEAENRCSGCGVRLTTSNAAEVRPGICAPCDEVPF